MPPSLDERVEHLEKQMAAFNRILWDVRGAVMQGVVAKNEKTTKETEG